MNDMNKSMKFVRDSNHPWVRKHVNAKDWKNFIKSNDNNDDGISSTKLVVTNTSRVHYVAKKKILVVTRKNRLSSLDKEIVTVIESNKFQYVTTVASNLQYYLTNQHHYALIIFGSLRCYFNLNGHIKSVFDDYCKKSVHTGIIVFAINETIQDGGNQSLTVKSYMEVNSVHINPNSPILRLTRNNGRLTNHTYLPRKYWTSFHDKILQPILYVTAKDGKEYAGMSLDDGSHDGIRRVYIGFRLTFWLVRLLFIDTINYLSNGIFQRQLKRWLQIDVDDVFVGKKGIRMTDKDVAAMLETQEIIEKSVPGFKFTLGFSGYYYKKGFSGEIEGDEAMVGNASKFWWFCHMWRHTKPHLFQSEEMLINDMERNKRFAIDHELNIVPGYSVSPHHSGIYPAYEPFYQAWKKVWNITVTSTEQYYHINPPYKRKGFIHHHISTLPRRTCGLFTKTLYFATYPGGFQRLNENIFGGELFRTLTDNIINIFMTHMPNFANDRLASYTFINAIEFLKNWTNIELNAATPVELGEIYFQMYPQERGALWSNPCSDKRHRAIWPYIQGCRQLPRIIIIGPQKTGTTAFSFFLSVHPRFKSNKVSKRTFEEVQFFNDNNYHKGLRWYMEFFPIVNQSSTELPVRYFEKSATYFDRATVPRRIHALIPDVYIVTILSDPVKRAYSWYQHMKNHSHPATFNNSFHKIITSKQQDRYIRQLQDRCLRPGKYVVHLEKWLDYFDPSHLIIIDGGQLVRNPIRTMTDFQIRMSVDDAVDYSTKLQFDQRKGFYCIKRERKRNKCLGRSKGRKYPPIDKASEQYLRKYYEPYNIRLLKLLSFYSLDIPKWLKELT